MKFTIYRDSWLRGDERSYLHRESDGKECCMGQMCIQLGATPIQLSGLLYPSHLGSIGAISGDLSKFIEDVKADQMRIGAINDAEVSTIPFLTSEEDRESRIKYEMGRLGYEVEFVDGKAPWIEG